MARDGPPLRRIQPCSLHSRMAPASCSTEIAHPRSGGSRAAVHSSSALGSLLGGTNLCGRSFRLLTQGWDSELSDKDLRPPGFGSACVVESGSFSAVARELGTGQPAVSKQVAALEEPWRTAPHAHLTQPEPNRPEHSGLCKSSARQFISSRPSLGRSRRPRRPCRTAGNLLLCAIG
jgi:hypothetical protein